MKSPIGHLWNLYLSPDALRHIAQRWGFRVFGLTTKKHFFGIVIGVPQRPPEEDDED